MMRHGTWFVAAVITMLWTTTALADAAPYDDDDDSAATCSLLELEFTGLECEACNPDECEERFLGTQFEYECTNYEGDTELEIWCEEQASTLTFCALLQQGDTPTVALTLVMSCIGLIALLAGRRR